jgi:hypothetical protein
MASGLHLSPRTRTVSVKWLGGRPSREVRARIGARQGNLSRQRRTSRQVCLVASTDDGAGRSPAVFRDRGTKLGRPSSHPGERSGSRCALPRRSPCLSEPRAVWLGRPSAWPPSQGEAPHAPCFADQPGSVGSLLPYGEEEFSSSRCGGLRQAGKAAAVSSAPFSSLSRRGVSRRGRGRIIK